MNEVGVTLLAFLTCFFYNNDKNVLCKNKKSQKEYIVENLKTICIPLKIKCFNVDKNIKQA